MVGQLHLAQLTPQRFSPWAWPSTSLALHRTPDFVEQIKLNISIGKNPLLNLHKIVNTGVYACLCNKPSMAALKIIGKQKQIQK